MKTTFSKILQVLQEHDITCAASSITNTFSYYGADSLANIQDSYTPQYLYLGEISDFNPAAAVPGCGFILMGNMNEVSLPPSAAYEYAILEHSVNMLSLIEIIRSFFAENFKQLECTDVLISSLMRGKGMKYLMDICCDILQNPVILASPDAHLLMISSKYEITDPAAQDLIKNGVSSPEFRAEFDKIRLPEKLNKNTKPILIDIGFSSITRRIIQGIYVSHQLIAILLVLETNKTFSDHDYSIIQVLANTIANEMNAQGNHTGALYEYQLLNMLHGEVLTQQQQTDWLSSLNWSTFSNFTICSIHTKSDQAFTNEMLFRNKYRYLPNCKAVCLDDDIVLIVNCQSTTAYQEFIKNLEELLISMNLRGGISKCFHNLDEMAHQYSLAREARAVGKIIMPHQALVRYDDVSSYCLIHKAAQTTDLTEFIAPQLTLLQDYDRKYGTEYKETLYRYLVNGTKNGTAEVLHVHKNTLNYRLQKISEIISTDIDNGQNRFNLLLSYQIIKYIEGR